MTQGDIKKDEKATTFFCEACLEEESIIEQSDDPRYCHYGFKFLLDEAERLPEGRRPSWVPVLGRTKGLPAVKEPVAKIPDKGLEGAGIMQRRGRPKKEGEVHRTTGWRRRQKGTQGVLF